MRDRLLIQSLITTAWALHEPVLRSLSQVIGRHAVGGKLTTAQIQQVVVEGQAKHSPRRRADYDEDGASNRSGNHGGSGPGYEMCECIAIIPVTGILAKRSSQVNDVSQPEGTACESLQMAFYHAMNNQAVGGILLDIDSPGGSIDGIADLATVIFKASKGDVPVAAHCNEMACSAAYWLASQCNSVYVSETAIAGSIGVYTVLHDVSKWFTEELLTEVHLVKAGARKGDGVPGTVISAEAIAAVQADIDACYDVFIKHVARGLGISRGAALALADGSTFVGQQAVEAGLADGVQSFDETLSQMIADARPTNGNVLNGALIRNLSSHQGADMATTKRRGRAAIKSSRPTGRNASDEELDDDDTSAEDEIEDTEAEEEEEEKPAARGKGRVKKSAKAKGKKGEEPVEEEEPQAVDEDGDGVEDEEKEPSAKSAVTVERRRCAAINAAFGHRPKFAKTAIEKGWSVSQAKAKAYDHGITVKSATSGGVKPLQAAGRFRSDHDHDDEEYESESGDPVKDFHDAVNAAAKRNGGNRMKARATVMKSDLDLHTAYLLATNHGAKKHSMIREREEMVG